jgi:hypothetical protein
LVSFEDEGDLGMNVLKEHLQSEHARCSNAGVSQSRTTTDPGMWGIVTLAKNYPAWLVEQAWVRAVRPRLYRNRPTLLGPPP